MCVHMCATCGPHCDSPYSTAAQATPSCQACLATGNVCAQCVYLLLIANAQVALYPTVHRALHGADSCQATGLAAS
jgi:hypothetical protein